MDDIDQIIIKPSKLCGEVYVSGAKNSCLRMLAASLLTPEKIALHNFPSGMSDVIIHVEMLKLLGKRCTIQKDALLIEEDFRPPSTLNWMGRSIRNTLLILGALVSRTGHGAVPLPGGCQIGERKFDLHEMLLKRLGADVWAEEGTLYAEASKGLTGNEIHLPFRSTGATENAIIAGTLAKGTTRIWNPHVRPEIIDLISFLNGMGAIIRVFGQEHIEVVGVEGLRETEHTVIPDNMEAITWLVAAVMTRGDVEIKKFPYRDLEVPLIHLRESGAKFFYGNDSLIARGGRCYPLDISTGPFPGINSDVQPILAAYSACAYGESRIIDLRFPGRYGYVNEMAKLGLEFSLDGNLLKIMGKGGQLKGAKVKALDLRAGAALALCGLVAEGETILGDAWQIARGYDNFIVKLQKLGGVAAAGHSHG